jgi:hypothetical protein
MFKKVGFWKEYTNNELDPSVFDSVLHFEYSDKENILSYLKSGCYVMGVRESPHKNPFGIQTSFRPHTSIFTDGVWVWTSGFIELFETYNIEADREFVTHIRSNLYEMKTPPTDETLDLLSELVVSDFLIE